MKTELEVLAKRFNEILRKQNKTPAEIDEKEELRLALEDAYTEDEEPLIEDLNNIGFDIKSVWDLVDKKINYTSAIPILITHLSKPYHIKNKEGIVRSLAVKEAKGVACNAIIAEYHKAPKNNYHYRWTFGNTMDVIITSDFTDKIIDIVQDEKNGESRHMFVKALGKINSLRVKEALLSLLSDDNKIIAKEAKKALKKFK